MKICDSHWHWHSIIFQISIFIILLLSDTLHFWEIKRSETTAQWQNRFNFKSLLMKHNFSFYKNLLKINWLKYYTNKLSAKLSTTKHLARKPHYNKNLCLYREQFKVRYLLIKKIYMWVTEWERQLTEFILNYELLKRFLREIHISGRLTVP